MMLQARRSLADVTESVAFNSFPFQWNDSTLLFRHWANWNSGNPSKNIIKQGFPMVFPWNNNQRLGNGGPMAFPWRPSQVLWPPALMGCWKLGEWKAMGKPWFRRMKHYENHWTSEKYMKIPEIYEDKIEDIVHPREWNGLFWFNHGNIRIWRKIWGIMRTILENCSWWIVAENGLNSAIVSMTDFGQTKTTYWCILHKNHFLNKSLTIIHPVFPWWATYITVDE